MDSIELTNHELGRGMELRLEHRRALSDETDALVENWWVTGVLVGPDEDPGPDEAQLEVVQARLVRCPLGRPDLLMTLDGMEADLGAVGYAVLDDTGDIREDLSSVSGIGSYLLIVDSVTVDKRFAGREVGRWIVAEAVSALNAGVALAAAIAAPLDGSQGAAREHACEKLRAVWSSIGFVDVDTTGSDSVLVLNPELKTTYARLQRLRNRFGVAARS